jgi:tetratricopeptide (TPR) repeat protein
MNYANCLYKKGDLKRSAKLYKQVFRSTFASDALKSDALLQLGVLSQNEPEAALQLFKKALEINPFNETARYNYELTYLLLDMDPSFSRKKRANNSSEKAKNKLGEKNNEGSQGNGLKQAGKGNETPALTNTKDQDPRTSGMQAKAKADAEGQKNKNNAEAQVLVVNKNDLKDLNLSPEQAVQMLDAMQTAEIQYLQQAPRKRIKQNKAKGNYKDW